MTMQWSGEVALLCADVGFQVRPSKQDEEAFRKRRQREINQINVLSGSVVKDQARDVGGGVALLPETAVDTQHEFAVTDADFADVGWEDGAYVVSIRLNAGLYTAGGAAVATAAPTQAVDEPAKEFTVYARLAALETLIGIRCRSLTVEKTDDKAAKKRKARPAAPRRSKAERDRDIQRHKEHTLAICAHTSDLVSVPQ
jgi:hypothetical protein